MPYDKSPTEFQNKILLYDLEARSLRTLGVFKADQVDQLAFSADSRQLVAVGKFGSIQTISLSSGRQRLAVQRGFR